VLSHGKIIHVINFIRKQGDDKTMLMEWLEPSIEKKINEVISICEIENEDVYKDFSNTLSHIRQNTPAFLMEDLLKLEEYFVRRFLVADTAYRIGFRDGVDLFNIKCTDK
jgi:hypothetical protein